MRVVMLVDINKQKDFQPINTSKMCVTADGKSVRVGSRVFKRTVLPSSATPQKSRVELEAAALLDELGYQE